MSPTLSLVLAALVGPGFENAGPVPAKRPVVQQETAGAYRSVREAREAVSQVLVATNRASGRDASKSAPLVLETYRRVARSEKLPAAERRQLQGRLRSRLAEQSEVLRREERGVPSLSGGVSNNAQELIDLIVTTIAPDTWEINGGKGSIFYFSNK